MQNRQAFLFSLLFLFAAIGSVSHAEIALPSEPVGNATDRAEVEKKTRRVKVARAAQLAQEKAHRLAHQHPKKKHRAARKITQAEGTQP